MSPLHSLAGYGRRLLRNRFVCAVVVFASAADPARAWYPTDLLQGFDEPVSLNLRVHRWQLRGTGNIMPLNGTNQYLDLGTDPLLHMSEHDFTVEAWVQFNALQSLDAECTAPSCGDMSLVDKMLADPVVDGDGWRLLKTADNHLWFCMGNEADGCAGGNATTAQSTTVVTTGAWYHVVGRKTRGSLSIYVNGVAEATIELGPFTDTGRAPLLIGRNEAEGAFLNGTIDTVGLYPQALKAYQIRDLYAEGVRRHRPQAAEPAPDAAEANADAAVDSSLAAAALSSTESPMTVGQLWVSSSADRSDPLPLDGLAVSGPLHVFLVPETGIRQVKFWLDAPTPTNPAGVPTAVEFLAPFDLMGTGPTGDALPLDPARLTQGTHTISVEAALTDGTRLPVLTGTFTMR